MSLIKGQKNDLEGPPGLFPGPATGQPGAVYLGLGYSARQPGKPGLGEWTGRWPRLRSGPRLPWVGRSAREAGGLFRLGTHWKRSALTVPGQQRCHRFCRSLIRQHHRQPAQPGRQKARTPRADKKTPSAPCSLGSANTILAKYSSLQPPAFSLLTDISHLG